jgi:metalloendopeptidase OMA1, mitochondrial
VFVFTGILPICRNDDGIATVLGHEIAHNVAHHAAERMSSGFVLSLGGIVALYIFGFPDFASRLLLTLGFERPGSRKQEAEADYIGLSMPHVRLVLTRTC